MPKCLKCELDDVPEDHALRCPMRKQFYPPTNTGTIQCTCGLNCTTVCPLHHYQRGLTFSMNNNANAAACAQPTYYNWT